MFKNFLKIACRHLWQTKLYALINVTGLAIGTACAATGSVAFVLTLVTVSSQAFMAALKNPVHSLRAE